MPRSWLLAAVALAAAVVSVAAVVLGWPERTPGQVLLLELAALPLQLAVGAGLLHLAPTAGWTPQRRWLGQGLGAGWLLGLLLLLLGYLTGPRSLVQVGQVVMWLALLGLLVLLVLAQPRSGGRLARFIRSGADSDDEPEDEDGDDEDADPAPEATAEADRDSSRPTRDGTLWTHTDDDRHRRRSGSL
jgi:uncharacterized membrane protein